MDIVVIYESILSKTEETLIPYGYKRSGKGKLFYRYAADRKAGCAIEMQKSMFNSPDSYSFTFNLSCVALDELSGYDKDKLTLAPLKTALADLYAAMRIGMLCRGRDYWWEITDDVLNEYAIEDYYDRFIRKDIEKAAHYLNELADQKARKYL